MRSKNPIYLNRLLWCLCFSIPAVIAQNSTAQESPLPIADVHVHYSHDSVELTPPARVIEIMREANLKFALVSSSDDKGTQLLVELAPDLIIPGLRPYRRRGELSTWFTDPGALAYVERLLATNRYATIGEFHLYGDDAELEIPRRIVQLADKYNLVLHAHSDADAVERLLSQSDTARVIWAHSGFVRPAQIAVMLARHDRLWADLAFRSEMGRGDTLAADWIELFTQFPDRMMLGTDTYTPERMYFVPENAKAARAWLAQLPFDLAERIAWKNAYELLMPIWQKNSIKPAGADSANVNYCSPAQLSDEFTRSVTGARLLIRPRSPIEVSKPFALDLTFCGEVAAAPEIRVDALMPAHGHGMNYTPEVEILHLGSDQLAFAASGLVLHMPGTWQWNIDVQVDGAMHRFEPTFIVE